ncbi:hypothetical protein ACFP3Q_15715 [Nocardioides sp. GCM10027113]|uniref:hypothetical protein n=1 Tax=unclassified Nocardioides TaxID=2615069 RepID=UPI0036150722
MKTHRLRATTIALTALVSAGSALLTAPPAQAAPTTDIRPAALDRGEPGQVAHVDGSDLVIGDRRYGFGDKQVQFLGYARARQLTHYMVAVHGAGGEKRDKVVRVAPDGDRRVVLSGRSLHEPAISSDGVHLFDVDYRRGDRTVIHAWSSRDGSPVASKSLTGTASVLDAHEGKAVLGVSAPDRTISWDLSSGATKQVSGRTGYQASIEKDRLAVLTGDPYRGGCSVVSTLRRPDQQLWRSCEQGVATFSPTGDRILTTHLAADGLGPNEYQLREVTGDLVRSFTTYYFGAVAWEADEVLLLDAHGERKSAWVRCTDAGDCERAGKLRATSN